MSAHALQPVPHDYRNCRTLGEEDCGTRIEVRCACGWAQGCATDAQAERIAIGHRADPDRDVVEAGPP
jgi:hypothetical protein